MNKGERVIYGLHACQAAAFKCSSDIIKAHLVQERVSQFSELLKQLAETKRAYKIVSTEELSRITSSIHHEGISFLLKEKPKVPLKILIALKNDSPALFVALVGVENPHNIGAIARSASHFGANGLIFVDAGEGSLSASSYRISQGALEYLPFSFATKKELLDLQKLNFDLIAPSPHKGTSIELFTFSKRSILLLGGEGAGLSKEIENKASSIVTIPGSGQVESLNVSAAAAVLLHSWKRSLS